MSQHLKYFPKPLLNDLVARRWLPVIGAGMSRNAVVTSGRHVPLWGELGTNWLQISRTTRMLGSTCLGSVRLAIVSVT